MKRIYGLIKPTLDIHTLGINMIKNLLSQCNEEVIVGDDDVSSALQRMKLQSNRDKFIKWVTLNHISHLGISYRLDPQDAHEIMKNLFDALKSARLFSLDGGTVDQVYFAGLPESCVHIKQEFGNLIEVFVGSEGIKETLLKMGIAEKKIHKSILTGSKYDHQIRDIARAYVESKQYESIEPPLKGEYPGYGTRQDRLVDRISNHQKKSNLPLTRAHVGPYQNDREKAVDEFEIWCRQLASTGYLDICSIGSSQLTQSNFNEDWTGLANGGGVPIQNEAEYQRIYKASRPMLVRTYSGTKNVDKLAAMHERSINIAWHALSFWWFDQLDGRGANDLLTNLQQHCETLRYIASTNKPFEPNIPHHFSFRGADDVTYIVSAILAARTAKKHGIKDFILQVMLNTPRYTWGIVDLAKARAILELIKPLCDDTFTLYLQPRAGLDYFSPDEQLAKIQLAGVAMLMDDIEPDNPLSPPIVHVVSYSEALYLATPPIIDESIKITLGSIQHYRNLKKEGLIDLEHIENDVKRRVKWFVSEATVILEGIENSIEEPYTPEGLYSIFVNGFLPTPYLWGNVEKFPNAVKFKTRMHNGMTILCDDVGKVVTAHELVESSMKNVLKQKGRRRKNRFEQNIKSSEVYIEKSR